MLLIIFIKNKGVLILNNFFPIATIDRKSNIIHQNNQFKNLFKCEKNLYSSPLLSPYEQFFSNQDKIIIEKSVATKTLLVNICEHNLILNKYPIILYDQIIGVQIIPEIFKVNNLKNLFQYTHFNCNLIPSKYLNINNYSELQQEIIFCMLRGYHTDKGIAHAIKSITKKELVTKTIERSIGRMYSKLLVNDRESLTNLFHCLNFDNYIPRTLYTSGVYSIESLI